MRKWLGVAAFIAAAVCFYGFIQCQNVASTEQNYQTYHPYTALPNVFIDLAHGAEAGCFGATVIGVVVGIWLVRSPSPAPAA